LLGRGRRLFLPLLLGQLLLLLLLGVLRALRLGRHLFLELLGALLFAALRLAHPFAATLRLLAAIAIARRVAVAAAHVQLGGGGFRRRSLVKVLRTHQFLLGNL